MRPAPDVILDAVVSNSVSEDAVEPLVKLYWARVAAEALPAIRMEAARMRSFSLAVFMIVLMIWWRLSARGADTFVWVKDFPFPSAVQFFPYCQLLLIIPMFSAWKAYAYAPRPSSWRSI